MGWLDLPAPGLLAIDNILSSWFPGYARIILWSLLTSALSMFCYRILSPQARLAALSGQAANVRKTMLDEAETPDQILRGLAKAFSILSKQMGLIIGPALVAILPVLVMLAWLSNAYGHEFPADNEEITIQIVSSGLPVHWERQPGGYEPTKEGAIRWPASGQILRLIGTEGVVLMELPHSAPVNVLHKRMWWNRLIGNPAGYLPDDSSIDEVHLDLPRSEWVSIGPSWMRGWEALFFASILLFSSLIKTCFRIH